MFPCRHLWYMCWQLIISKFVFIKKLLIFLLNETVETHIKQFETYNNCNTYNYIQLKNNKHMQLRTTPHHKIRHKNNKSNIWSKNVWPERDWELLHRWWRFPVGPRRPARRRPWTGRADRRLRFRLRLRESTCEEKSFNDSLKSVIFKDFSKMLNRKGEKEEK